MKAGAIIFNRNFDKVLLVKNRNSQKWGFPKGSSKQKENYIQCANREVMEETNINLSDNGNVFSSIKLSHYIYLLGYLKESVEYKINDWKELDSIKFVKINDISLLNANSSLKQFNSLYYKNPYFFHIYNNHEKIKTNSIISY